MLWFALSAIAKSIAIKPDHAPLAVAVVGTAGIVLALIADLQSGCSLVLRKLEDDEAVRPSAIMLLVVFCLVFLVAGGIGRGGKDGAGGPSRYFILTLAGVVGTLVHFSVES